MTTHAHQRLRAELRRLIVAHEPAVVQVECIELAELIGERQRVAMPRSATRPDRRPGVGESARSESGRAPRASRQPERWILDLHDVLLHPDPTQRDAVDRHEAEWIERFDRVLVCSPEDEAILASQRATRIENGVDLAALAPQPSSSTKEVLFCGPFRYGPNLAGIRMFLQHAWPDLRRRVPAAQLVVLGGSDAATIAARDPLFHQEGVTVRDRVLDPRPDLARCALTINPVFAVRGSSVKVLESLAAGRVCVATPDGARGLTQPLPAGLVVVESFEDFGAEVARLLVDVETRGKLERETRAGIAQFDWQAIAPRLHAVYRTVLGAGDAG